MEKFLIVFALVSTAVTSASAACYTVYMDEKVIYQSSIEPVDLSFPFSQTLPAKFGEGATMVYLEGSNFCPDLDSTSNTSGNQSRSSARQLSATNSKLATANSAVQLPTSRSAEYSSSDFTSANYSGPLGYGSRSDPGAIQTGPRGGQYYINSSGNKTY